MAKELLLHRHDCRTCGINLKATDQLAEEDLATFKPGKDVLVEARHPRSTQHHRLLFAMLRKVCRAAATPLTEEALLSYVKVKTGHVQAVPLSSGRDYLAPASIAFANMDQAQFREFFDRVVALILTDIAPHLPDSFADEFLAMLDDKTPTPATAAPLATAPAAPRVQLAEDLNGAPYEVVLAWADLFEATLAGCRVKASAEKYWRVAQECGRLRVLRNVAPERFNELLETARDLGQSFQQTSRAA